MALFTSECLSAAFLERSLSSFFPSLSKASSPAVSTAASYSAPVSTGSSSGIVDFFSSLLPRATQAVSSAIQSVADAGRSVVSSVSGFVSNLFGRLVNFAKSFVGRVNSDREGNRLFSGGRNQAWCADFVTYCARKIFGNKLPSDFGSSAVSNLRAWGDKHGCYLKAPYEQGRAAMANFLKNRVKPGDIMIEKRNGKSHTGIVTYVDPNGQYFKTVEGNASNSVKEVTYQADSKTLSGFVSLSKFA